MIAAPSEWTVGELFAGIGGFGIAAEAVGWQVIWQAEVDPACCGWLAEHFPGIPNLGDVRKVDWSTVRRPNVLMGGFPCQPHSHAGKKEGSADERDLWPEFERCIGIFRPDVVVAENVPGLFTSDGGQFFGTVLGALAALGYDAEWVVVSAADVGAPHERERVWIVAYASDVDAERRGEFSELARPGGTAEGEAREREWGRRAAGDRGTGLRGTLADADGTGLVEQRRAQPVRPQQSAVEHGRGVVVDPAQQRRGKGQPESVVRRGRGAAGRPGGEVDDADGGRREQYHPAVGDDAVAGAGRLRRWDDATAIVGADGITRLVPREAAEAGPESPLWPVADGLPGRVARLRAIGNAVCPAVVVEILERVRAYFTAQAEGVTS